MKKEDFVKLGLPEDLAEKAAQASSEELKGYIPLARFNEVNEAKKHAEDSLKERDKQIDSLKALSGDAEKLKLEIEDLQKANKQKDSDHAAEILRLKVDNAVTTALTAAKAKNLKAVRALLDLDKAQLDESGQVAGLADQIKKLQEAEDSRFMFDGAPRLKGAKTGEQGVDDGDGKPDLDSMSYEELSRYFSENPQQ